MFGPPSFWQDWGRHGFSAAWSKRYGSMSLGGRSLSYSVLLRMPWEQVQWCLSQAIIEDKHLEACWAFEALMIQAGGDDDSCWRCAASLLGNHNELKAATTLEFLLKYVDDFESFKGRTYGFWCDYLMGLVHLKAAKQAKGVNKTSMKDKKALSMHHLSRAREVMANVSRQQANNPFVAYQAKVAAAYEEAFYLVYKGTKTTAMAE